MKNILVTGGAGYIGSILIPDLLNSGYKVTVLDNFMYGQSGLNHCAIFDNFEVYRGDVRDESLVKSLLKKNDIIFPLAALVGAPLCKADPYGADSINKQSVLLMLQNLSKEQVVIMPTTNSAYGSGNKDNFCTEESELKPISKYASDKVIVEQELMEHENTISLRLATVFGMSPRMRLDLLVNDFTFRAVYDGFIVLFESQFKRNYIHVRDISRVFHHCVVHFKSMKENIYNVGLSSANISKSTLLLLTDVIVAEALSLKSISIRSTIARNNSLNLSSPSFSRKLIVLLSIESKIVLVSNIEYVLFFWKKLTGSPRLGTA